MYSPEETPVCKHGILTPGDMCNLYCKAGAYWTLTETSSSAKQVSGQVSHPD